MDFKCLKFAFCPFFILLRVDLNICGWETCESLCSSSMDILPGVLSICATLSDFATSH